jgi:hypothetical protein
VGYLVGELVELNEVPRNRITYSLSYSAAVGPYLLLLIGIAFGTAAP